MALRTGQQRGPDVQELAAFGRPGSESDEGRGITVVDPLRIDGSDQRNIPICFADGGTGNGAKALVAQRKRKLSRHRVEDRLVRIQLHEDARWRLFEALDGQAEGR